MNPIEIHYILGDQHEVEQFNGMRLPKLGLYSHLKFGYVEGYKKLWKRYNLDEPCTLLIFCRPVV